MGDEYIKFGRKITNGSQNMSQNVCLGSAWTPGVLIRVKQYSAPEEVISELRGLTCHVSWSHCVTPP